MSVTAAIGAELNSTIASDLAGALVTMVDYRDPYTAIHMSRVSWLAINIGEALGFDQDRLAGLRIGSHLHDLGKSSIPPEILNKPGRLSERELELIREHPRIGSDIARRLTWPWPIADMILQHHERIDGKGYPLGIGGGEMLDEAKIIAVADVVDAMISHRPYRPALPVEKAVGELRRGCGILYETIVVDACVDLLTAQNFTMPANTPDIDQTADRS